MRRTYPPVLRRPVAVTASCFGTKHKFTVDRDWCISTAHDLEQDRLLIALGGEETECLALAAYVDKMRVLADLHARRLRYPIRFIEPGVWELAVEPRRRRTFVSVLLAAEFIRAECSPSNRDVAGSFELRAEIVKASEIRRVPRLWARMVAPLFVEPNAADLLWRAGVHPRTVLEDRLESEKGASSPISVFGYLERYYSKRCVARNFGCAHIDTESHEVSIGESFGHLKVPRLVEDLLGDSWILARMTESPILPVPCYVRGSDADDSDAYDTGGEFQLSDDDRDLAITNRQGQFVVVPGIFRRIQRSRVKSRRFVVIEHWDKIRPHAVVCCDGLKQVDRDGSGKSNISVKVIKDIVFAGLDGELRASGVVDLLEEGEPLVALIAILSHSERNATSVMSESVLAMLYLMVLCGGIPTEYADRIFSSVMALWLDRWPSTWGINSSIHSGDLLLYDFGCGRVPLDIECVQVATERLLIALQDQIETRIGHAGLNKIVARSREDELTCYWGNARTRLRPRRSTRTTGTWLLETESDVRSKAMGVLIVRAFVELTGRWPAPTELPQDCGIGDDPGRVVQVLFDIDELIHSIHIAEGGITKVYLPDRARPDGDSLNFRTAFLDMFRGLRRRVVEGLQRS
ncbi:MAG: hypothetical protein KC435_14545 [Thermomicrobiales bacterium]|nr:hypothetical protein [Thermomicrobiales bacterium]